MPNILKGTRFFAFCALAVVLAAGTAKAEDQLVKPIVPAANPIPNTSPFIKPAPDLRIKVRKTELVKVRLLSTRPSSIGGVQPFSVRDVRNKIDPNRIVASKGNGNCPNGTGSTTTNLIVFLLPSNGSACSFLPAIGVGTNPDVVFTAGGFTVTNATLTPSNGWSVSPTIVNSSDTVPVANTVTISKGGVTYSMTLNVLSDQLSPGDGNLSVQNFMGF